LKFYTLNSDIPQYLIDGVVDIAIVGDNLLVEKENSSSSKTRFSKCKVSVAVPKTFEYNLSRFRWFAYRYFLSKHCN
jgi:ATP phosphoribosyltransferase